MSDLKLNVVKKVRSLYFLQHLTPSQTFITSKKFITTAKRKKVAKSRIRTRDTSWRCPLGYSSSRQNWFNCAIYACAI